MAQEKEYFAFISYQRRDEEWAKWLQHKLEHYHLPTTLNGKDLPKNLCPIFRDVDELSAGNLPEQIYHALSISKNLIVVCSPHSAQSEWVNKEVEDFIKIKGGKADNIYPFIIEGIPFSKDINKECFPKKLRYLHESEERLGSNINEQGGRNAAVVKIIAGMLGIGFDSLWQKYERERRKNRNWMLTAAIFAILCISGIASWMYWQNWKMKENIARFVSEKAIALAESGDSYLARLLLLEVLPNNLNHPNYPYVAEAESAFRVAAQYENAILEGHTSDVNSASFSPDGKRIISASNDKTIRIWDAETGRQIGKPLKGHTSSVISASFSPDGKRIVSASYDKTIRIWNYPSLQEPIDETRERFKNRQLTLEERRKYYLE